VDREFLYAEVAFSIPIPRPCFYVVPAEMKGEVEPGRLVLAPLGRKEHVGCVVAVASEPPGELRYLRPLLRPVSPEFRVDNPLIELARWVADYYLCTVGEALAAVSFIGFTEAKLKKERRVILADSWRAPGGGGETESALLKGASARRRVLDILREAGEQEVPSLDLLGRARTSRSALEPLIAAGAVEECEVPLPWRPRSHTAPPRDTPPPLTPQQQDCFDAVAGALDDRRYEAFLLQGVTGSGKTEIYLRAIQRCLDQGRQAICLVPEIALTPQTLERFQARFGEAIGLCHGRMTRTEKLHLYRAVQSREVNVVIGPRSAVFSPVPDLGLLVIDEEHEGTYKQDETPRYHARDVGLVRARDAGAVAILGTATPSLESLANARAGKYVQLSLPDRIDNRPLPPVEVVDMAAELREAHNPTLFSARLETAIRERLERGEQVILFLNRRGFANFVLCPRCGHLPRCPDDDVALTYHVYRPREFQDDVRAGPKGTRMGPGSSGSKPERGRRAVTDEDTGQQDLFEGLWSRDMEELRKAKGLPPGHGTAGPKGAGRARGTPAEKEGGVSERSDRIDHSGQPDKFDRAERSTGKSEAEPAEKERGDEIRSRVGPSYLARSVLDSSGEPEAAGATTIRLVCHFCGRKIPMPPRCPQCADPRLTVVGQGTQRIEEELGRLFPQARLLRMDLDTMSKRNAYDEAWRRITRGQVDIILGTQIIAKGLHLERVTLVGVVLADVGLFVPDFRASERTFALLTQVAGRAGRGERGGQVVVQTYVPQNAAIQCALTHNVEKFAEHEMKRRQWLRFPPVTRLAGITLSGKQLDAVLEAASGLVGILRRRRHQDAHAGCTVLGPMPAPLSRLRGKWRQRILVRAEQPGPLHLLLRAALGEYESRPHPSGVRIVTDIDPLDLM